VIHTFDLVVCEAVSIVVQNEVEAYMHGSGHEFGLIESVL